ncbi:hypothetical protein PR048_007625 [Dryococelus australis]|uniref:Uncharacterized protein n=1 Tax=Dryococelus australis TaxID=614101 RepID=A0ABQ9HUS1_9NEOP|nr:hypothetical protein PR048_007625 [Dryococelus australis]
MATEDSIDGIQLEESSYKMKTEDLKGIKTTEIDADDPLIILDSHNLLTALSSPTLHKMVLIWLIQEQCVLLNKLHFTVCFMWVLGHLGIHENEMQVCEIEFHTGVLKPLLSFLVLYPILNGEIFRCWEQAWENYTLLLILYIPVYFRHILSEGYQHHCSSHSLVATSFCLLSGHIASLFHLYLLCICPSPYTLLCLLWS